MGLLEKDALLCQLVDVWCLRLGMSSKTTNPVVQIVDGDEQDVGRVRRVGCIDALFRWQDSDEECNRRKGYRSEGLCHRCFECSGT